MHSRPVALAIEEPALHAGQRAAIDRVGGVGEVDDLQATVLDDQRVLVEGQHRAAESAQPEADLGHHTGSRDVQTRESLERIPALG